jgi:hypothetical protein
MDKLIAAIEAIAEFLSKASPLLDKAGRLVALFDKSALIMLVPSLVGLYYYDPDLTKTLMQWTTPAVSIAGLSIIVSRLIFPQIKIDDLIDQVKNDKSMAAAIVVASLVLFVGVVFLGIVTWAKA